MIHAQTGAETTRLAEPLQRLAGGFDTDTFRVSLTPGPPDWPERIVLRLYPPGSPAARATIEGAAQRALARQGFDCPDVLQLGEDLFGPLPVGTEGGTPRPFMLMEFVSGDVLLSHTLWPPPIFFRTPGIMARALADLHELDPGPFLEALALEGIDGSGFAVSNVILRHGPVKLTEDDG